MGRIRRKLRFKTHHFAVDSAANELLATEIQRRPILEDIKPLIPNCQAAVRDTTHSCRRILSRPWTADKFLHECVTNIARGKGSPAIMIQNSLDLQTRFREAVRRLHPRLKRPTANLRAAKHRFETFSKPLARTCSTFLAIVDVMNYTAIHGKSRKGFDSKAAAKQ